VLARSGENSASLIEKSAAWRFGDGRRRWKKGDDRVRKDGIALAAPKGGWGTFTPGEENSREGTSADNVNCTSFPII